MATEQTRLDQPTSYALGKATRLNSPAVTDREQALSFGKAADLYE
jgi:hypothetical protein